MAKEIIKVSLTEFMNFVNKSGTAKATVVSNSKNKRDDEYEHYKDYWLKLREKLKSVHKKSESHDDLRSLLDDIHKDKKANYKIAIEGYIKFWKKRKLEWVNPPRKTWKIGDVRIELNPELGIAFKDKIFVIKLFTTANSDINKMHADLILNLMEKELREKVAGEEVVFAVLDVKRGKLFENKTKDTSLYPLLNGEARSFETIWKSI
ncbi:hypothetical protein M8845_02105 [Gelidibacter japonicus]|uniref:hypothetical protein n=1 Tax=Gelidibacter japonicus TaxID=1962232 RepID=UPI00201FE25F|nr:hypothetical protein [Gelidibacter japonicus]MCL8006211.1 hypothetical protein [Gelidibacter japonicus]